MSSKILSVIAVVLAFRGSYLIRSSKTPESLEYGRFVSLSAAVLALTALLLRS